MYCELRTWTLELEEWDTHSVLFRGIRVSKTQKAVKRRVRELV